MRRTAANSMHRSSCYRAPGRGSRSIPHSQLPDSYEASLCDRQLGRCGSPYWLRRPAGGAGPLARGSGNGCVPRLGEQAMRRKKDRGTQVDRADRRLSERRPDRSLVGCSVSSVTLRAPLPGQDKAHFAGNGRPFSRSATRYRPGSGAPFGPAHKRHRRCFARLN